TMGMNGRVKYARTTKAVDAAIKPNGVPKLRTAAFRSAAAQAEESKMSERPSPKRIAPQIRPQVTTTPYRQSICTMGILSSHLAAKTRGTAAGAITARRA